jgi:hypothetical protein
MLGAVLADLKAQQADLAATGFPAVAPRRRLAGASP